MGVFRGWVTGILSYNRILRILIVNIILNTYFVICILYVHCVINYNIYNFVIFIDYIIY